LKEQGNSFTVTEENLGARLDQLLCKQYPEHSRSYFQYLIDENFVLLNGSFVKKQHRPQLGDEVVVTFQPKKELDLKAEAIDLSILFEDEDIIAINKPPSFVVHPAPGAYSGTFANALLYHCQKIDPDEFAPFRPGIVHRLDKDTTGVLVAAKTLRAHQNLSQQFSQRKVEKKYLALCVGSVTEGRFSAPIKRHPTKRKQMTVSEDGKEAISLFKTLAKKEDLSLVEIQLITGRTHQIRAHLKHLNCFILGDPVYGNPAINRKKGINRQLLHAQSLKITHPISEIPLELHAPIPLDMKKFIDWIQPP